MTYRHSLGITFVQHKYTSVSYNTVTIHSLSVLLQGLTEAVTTYAPQVSALAGTSFSMCPFFTHHTLCYSSRSISLYEVAALFTLKVTMIHVRAKIYAFKAM